MTAQPSRGLRIRRLPNLVIGPLILLLALPSLAKEEVKAEKRSVAGEPKQEYFLMHRPGAKAPKKGYKVLLVLPGGDGSAAFHPFVTNIAKQTTGEDYLVAQLVSVKWTPDQKIIWPTAEAAVPAMKFSTEEYLAAVLADLGKSHKIDAKHIYTLAWSSGGPAAYAASLSVPEITGSFIAMSVFKPATLKNLAKARGHRYYLYQSPDDKVCPFRMAENARKVLTEHKATVTLETYDGGHGWHGNIFGAIRKGLTWLEDPLE